MILDVVIHQNERFLAANENFRATHPPVEARCELGFQVWVGRLDHRIAKAVMDFCTSTCLGAPSPVTQFAQLYAFARELPDGAPLEKWDDDNQLQNCVALSRLIHPTSTGFNYAARVRINGDGQHLQLCRAEVSGMNVEAHVSPNEDRDWLTQGEAEDLVHLLVAARTGRLPTRLSNALWYHEFAFRTWFADVRWTLVCTALEALLNTSEYQNRKQFVTRLVSLAQELGLRCTADDANMAYTVRSKLAHGEAFLYDLPKADLRIYDQMESVLRACILRAFQEPEFAAIFKSAADVNARWPMPVV